MGVDPVAVLDRARDRLLVGLHHIQRAGLASLLGDVEDHERVVAAHDLVGQVEPPGAGVHDGDARRERALAKAPGDLAAETVIPQPGVTDAGDQNAPQWLLGHVSITSTSGAKKYRKRPVSRRMSRPGSSSTVAPRCTFPS